MDNYLQMSGNFGLTSEPEKVFYIICLERIDRDISLNVTSSMSRRFSKQSTWLLKNIIILFDKPE